MKIAAYCRVSTAKEEQLDSLAHQKEFFQSYALKNGYELVNIYADEGITGTRMQKRDQFQALLRDAAQHQFELVVVKDISRFARNTVDFLQSVRALKALGVNTRFLTADMDSLGESEFVLTMFGALAQEESANLSKRVKFGKKLNAQKGRVPQRIYGYDRVDNFTLRINESEADVVRLMYEMYVGQGLGCRTIARQLDAWGYTTKLGCGWTPSAVHRILTNPIYCGLHINHKYEVENYLTGRQRKLPVQEQYRHSRPQWAIISPEQFQQAQAQRKARHQVYGSNEQTHQGRYSARHLFSGLILCQECGRSFCRKSYTYAHTRTYWKCWGSDQGLCANSTKVEEDQLLAAIADYVSVRGSGGQETEETLVQWAKRHRNGLAQAEKEEKRLERKRERLALLYANEGLTLEEFLKKQEEIQTRISALQQLKCGEQEDEQRVREQVRRYMGWQDLTRGDMAKLVERITVDGRGEVRVQFCAVDKTCPDDPVSGGCGSHHPQHEAGGKL